MREYMSERMHVFHCQVHLMLPTSLMFKVDQFHISTQKLFVVHQQMDSQLHVFLLTGAVCVCVWFWRVHRPLGMHHCPATPTFPPPALLPPSHPPRPPPSPPSSSYEAAQQPIRGASPLIRVTNWGLAGAETPPHLHGHVTFKEVRRVKGRVVGGERRGRVWISVAEQTKRGVKGGKQQAARWQKG